ncbi:MAG: tetratricopeptide repeat protein [Candidatus Rokuibacteriota bacterium]
MWCRLAPLALALTLLPAAAGSSPSVEQQARELIARYHEDPTRLDRARDLLEAAIKQERRVDTLILLARVHFLVGDVRATTPEAKLAAYDRGRELGQRAVELAPRSEEAHLWYAINTGRWGQARGVVRSLFLLPTVREELDIIFGLNPKSARGHALAGNVMFEVPGLLGGDRRKAEEHYRKALQIDPRFTVVRVDLARLLIATGRHDEARRELTRVIDERAPTSIADWTVKDVPRARALLDSLRAKP